MAVFVFFSLSYARWVFILERIGKSEVVLLGGMIEWV
jgi:hypothetical protein